MKWQLGRRSSNVEDRRGQGIGAKGIGGLGIGGVLIVVVISMLMGKDPTEILGQVAQQQGAPTSSQVAQPTDDEASKFVGSVLGSTEDIWG
ncbi:MAG: neutral zinc metallopeptidase, partial [Frankiaceae bacterium]|nr:neutral zinc metallopeptidase [Arenimonas sp.]